MAEKTWEELYRKYGIKRENSHKTVFIMALAAIVLIIVSIIFITSNATNLSNEYSRNGTSATPSETQQNNLTPSIPSDTTPEQAGIFLATYNCIDSRFVFSVKSLQQTNIETINVSIDGMKADYIISSGKMPLQFNETISFSISNQLYDKEHIISVSADYQEQKITTYPLACSMRIK